MFLLRDFLLKGLPTNLLINTGLLVLRLAFGLAMALQHGRATVSGWRSPGADFPDPLGLGSYLSMLLMGSAEFFCALAVAAGLLTRLSLLPLVFGFGVAVLAFHAGDPFGHKELAFLYGVAFTGLLLTGPGCFSLDYLIFKKRTS